MAVLLFLFPARRRRRLLLAPLALLAGFVGSVRAERVAADASADRTQSPYFWVKPVGLTSDGPAPGGLDGLPLKSTHVSVSITGSFADVCVVQRYANIGHIPLEAVYVFPGSTRAAVHGLTLQIGDRRIEAKIQERTAARQTYETAKHEGKTASLLEEHRPNVFQMNVANILPGDEISVELHYTEFLVPTEGVYEFVYPTVVGPRYSTRTDGTGAPGNGTWVANPYLHKGEVDPVHFALDCRLSAGVPLAQVSSPSYPCKIDFDDEKSARIRTDPTAKSDRDFILHFALRGRSIQSGLMFDRSNAENFFLLTVQPPERIASVEMPAREYDFIIDVSGSMIGFPLDTAKGLASDLLSHLRSNDSFNIVLFSGSSQSLSPRALPATTENIQRALKLIDGQQGGGGTELLPALQSAFALAANDDVARTFLVITDGYVDVEAEAFEWVRSKLGKANLFAFGIGSAVNRHLMEGLARVGQGEPFIATDPENAREVAAKFRQYVARPLLTHIQIAFDGFDAYDVEPAQVADLFAERPLVVLGKFRGKPTGRIVLTGTTGAGPFRSEQAVAQGTEVKNKDGLAHFWARTRIGEMEDLYDRQPTDDRKTEITQLGLKYNLLTRSTSFVAVDERVRRIDARLTTLRQPLALPHGVEDSGVGGSVPAAPEPSAIALAGFGALLLLLWAGKKRFNQRLRNEKVNT